MSRTTVPTLTVGDQTRRLVTATVNLIDHRSGHETVELIGTGPDGQAHLTGSLADVLSLVWQLDIRLHRLARGQA